MDIDDDNNWNTSSGPATNHFGGIGSRRSSIRSEHSEQKSKLKLKARLFCQISWSLLYNDEHYRG